MKEEGVREEVSHETLFAGPPSARRRRRRSPGGLAAADRPTLLRQSVLYHPLAEAPPPEQIAEPQAPRRGTSAGAGPRRPETSPPVGAEAARRHASQELAGRVGVRCSRMAIFRTLRKLKITRKKKSLHAKERDSPRVRRKRRAFREEVATVDPEHLVFIDETGANTAMTRTYGRAPRGQRVQGSVPGHWKSVTVIAGLRLSGAVAPLAF